MQPIRKLISAILALVLLSVAAPSFAETIEESVVRQLREQGFTEFEVERTFLGRIKIEAKSPTLEREIVINPNTGEILRDYWEYRSGRKASKQIVIPSVGGTSATPSTSSGSTSGKTTLSTSRSSGSNFSGHEDDDEDHADDDRISNSGKGSVEDDERDEEDDHKEEDHEDDDHEEDDD